MKSKKHIAILGGGPSGLFMFKRLVDANDTELTIDIFEKKLQLGTGMPYSADGANDEHITNVSGNEIPDLVTSISDWISTVSKDTLDKFHIDPQKFNDFKVLPRLLFGQYLSAQFAMLQRKAKEAGIAFKVHYNSQVTDIIDYNDQGLVVVEVAGEEKFEFDQVIICTGHNWPRCYEGTIPNYYDSPYPPSKLAMKVNNAIAIKGASLTAIDAIRTLTRHNGTYNKDNNGKLHYTLKEDCPDFKMVMHSRNGLLPALRFHLEDSHLSKDSVLSPEVIKKNRGENEGFLSLDFVFEENFKKMIADKEPEFYEEIKNMSMEKFVDMMMNMRETIDSFNLLKAEYIEAEKSIKKRKSVYWKEMLAVLSFAMNYPAKYFSAEDMLRLQKGLMPLISIVIAFVPQSSVEEMLALHEAGVLEIVSVGEDSHPEPNKEGGAIYYYTDDEGKQHAPKFKTYIDCVGQPHLAYNDLPYKSLLSKQTVSPAKLKFRYPSQGAKEMEKDNKKVEVDSHNNYYLNVQGITINDSFQLVDNYGAFNERIYIMAVPYIGGYNPDYSGLDFCEAASASIVKSMLEN